MKNKDLQIKTITKNDLAKLAEGGRNGSFSLSFYLGLNQGVNFRSEANSILSRETERVKKEKEYSASDKKKILMMLNSIKKEISFLRLPKDANVLVFFARNKAKAMIYRVPIYIQSKIVIESDYYLEPLARAIEQFSRYLAVALERDRAEFYKIFLGEIEGEPEVIKSDVPKKIRTSTSDDWKGRREQRIERHIEDHLKRHFKSVALKIREYFDRDGFNYLIIGGHGEIKAKFSDFLDKKSTEKMIGFFSLSHYDRGSIKEKSMAIINEYEKTREEKIVNELLDNVGGKKWTTVVGIESILENFYLHKVKMFVIGASYKKPGYICIGCHRISLVPESCLSCSGKVVKVSNLVDEITEEALKNKVEIKRLFHSHKKFDRFGIGAYLKGY